MHLALLQREVFGEHLGDPVRVRLRVAIGIEQDIGRGGEEADRRQGGDAQGEPKLEIDPRRRHGRILSQNRGGSRKAAPTLEAQPAAWKAGAAQSGNLPGHRRDAFAFVAPLLPRNVPGETTGICNMRHFLLTILAAGLWLAPSCGEAEDGGAKAQGAAIAVIDFDYVDTSGEARDQRKEHEARLAAFAGALRNDLAKGAQFRVVTPVCRPEPCSLTGTTVPNLLAAARAAGADVIIIGGVHKMSTLVQWAKIEAIDAKTGRILLDKLFTFRGDTDDAWRRAEAFIFDEITAIPRS